MKVMALEIERLLPVIKEVIVIEPLVFLVNVKIKPTNNIKVYLDADTGLSIELCARITRKLRKEIEEKGWYGEGDFSLEVSSPGVDEPLTMLRQYQKNVGRKLEVTLLDEQVLTGTLKKANNDTIEIEVTEGKGKKATVKIMELLTAQIKKAIVQIVF
jgi:ribosome maturation factor RimP